MSMRVIAVLLLFSIPFVSISGQEVARSFPERNISAGELLRYTMERGGVYPERQDTIAAADELQRRLDSGTSRYLQENELQAQIAIATVRLYATRWNMESMLYDYQQNPEQLINMLQENHYSQEELALLPNAGNLQELSRDNLVAALNLLALFAAYDVSLGEWEHAQNTLKLARQLPEGIPEEQMQEFNQLQRGLNNAIKDYQWSQLSVRPLAAIIAIAGFGITAAGLCDLLIPDFSLPYLPGDQSSARTAAIGGISAGGALIGFSALTLPQLVRRPPLEQASEYLAEEWGHLIEGAMQVFEDRRGENNQLLLLSLERGRFVVFAESPQPRELPSVFKVSRTGRFRLQVSQGAQRMSTPLMVLHPGVNIIPLSE